MLDEQLCKILDIDEFTQWIMKRLDCVEDELHTSDISNARYIELKVIYSTLKEVRDTYCDIKQGRYKKMEDDVKKENATTYRFEIAIIDEDEDPSRFKVLTHHFDYLCPLYDYPEATVYGVEVNIEHSSDIGHKINVTGYITGEDISVSDLLLSTDLTDWGEAYIGAINFYKEDANVNMEATEDEEAKK